MNEVDPQARLDIMVSAMLSCVACPLSENRQNVVPGTGPANANIMFIGEGPGANEDLQGYPFVGKSGRLLDELLNMIGWNRKDVYITNTVKCRPPENRDPFESELKICQENWLDPQIAVIQPSIIVPLGLHALQRVIPGMKIGDARGKTFSRNGFTIFPTYHPAAALRQKRYKEILTEDFKQLPSLINNILNKGLRTTVPPPTTNESHQINLC